MVRLTLDIDIIINDEGKLRGMAPLNANSMERAYVEEVHLSDDTTVANMEGTAVIQDENTAVEEAEITSDRVSVEDTLSQDKITYEEYKRMTPLDKAQSCGFARLRSYDTVEGVVKFKLMELGHKPSVDELMEEMELLYKGMRELAVKNKVDEVLEAVEKRGLPFICWTPREKAELLQFQMDDNSYNMQLYNAVCKACGIDTSDMGVCLKIIRQFMIRLWKCREIKRLAEVKVAEAERDRVLCLWPIYFVINYRLYIW